MLSQSSVLSYGDVVHQFIWNNQNITVQKLSLFETGLFSKGIVTIGDLLSDTGIYWNLSKALKGVKALSANLSPIEQFKLMSIVDAIPREWKQIISRQSTRPLPSKIGDTIYLKIENSEGALSKLSSKLLYRTFKSKKQVPPTAQKKSKEKFPQPLFDWKKIYSSHD